MTDHTSDSALPETQNTPQSEAIRELNDRFRKLQTGGTIVATPSIVDLGPIAVHEIMQQISAYEDFTEDNNPYGENDFGAVIYEGFRLF